MLSTSLAHLWGKSTGHWWMPLTKGPLMLNFDVFIVVSSNELWNKQSKLPVIWDATMLMWYHCNPSFQCIAHFWIQAQVSIAEATSNLWLMAGVLLKPSPHVNNFWRNNNSWRNMHKVSSRNFMHISLVVTLGVPQTYHSLLHDPMGIVKAFHCCCVFLQGICWWFCCVLFCCCYTIGFCGFTWCIYPYSSGFPHC